MPRYVRTCMVCAYERVRHKCVASDAVDDDAKVEASQLPPQSRRSLILPFAFAAQRMAHAAEACSHWGSSSNICYPGKVCQHAGARTGNRPINLHAKQGGRKCQDCLSS